MNKTIFGKGYSIAEALVTMVIIMLLIVLLVPTFIGKRAKKVVHVVGKDQHGIAECPPDTDCDVILPDTRDIFVIATGGGGGGAGSYCGDDIQRYYGAKDKRVSGKCTFESDVVLYFESSGAGGGSSQGFCDPYPGYYIESTHKKNCKIFPNTKVTFNDYDEHRLVKQVNECRDIDDTDSCKTYEKDEDGKDTDVCEEYNKKNVCQDWDTDPPEYYWERYLVNSTTKNVSCDLNYPFANADCRENYNPGGRPYPIKKTFEHIGTDIEKEKIIDFGKSLEAINTKRDDVCEIDWVFAPEKSISEHRYCNGALHGGRGGYGEFYKERMCPQGKQNCTQKRLDHAIASFCTDEQLEAQARSKKDDKGKSICPYGMIKEVPNHSTSNSDLNTRPESLDKNDQAPADEKLSEKTIMDIIKDWLKDLYDSITNPILQAVYPECNHEKLRQELRAKKICGHNIGEYNCYVEHNDYMKGRCNVWQELGTMTTAFEIGVPGKGGPFNYSLPGIAATDSLLFKTIDNIDIPGGTREYDHGIINMSNDMKLRGGVPGKFTIHGDERDKLGVKGGLHEGISNGAYGQYVLKTHNTLQGDVGYVQCLTTWVQAGLGGEAGETQSGYIKNASGTVEIKVGEGGAGGIGSSLSKIVVDIANSLSEFPFPIKIDLLRPSDSTVKDSAAGSDGQNTTVTSGGQTITALGGKGGAHTKIYEKCSAGSSAIYLDKPAVVEYEGKKGKIGSNEYGKGGDGEGTAAGEQCKNMDGHAGERGGVTIFY